MPLPFYYDSSKPLALVTNDDGIDSNFRMFFAVKFHNYEIIVCAPDGERSWIGHAILVIKSKAVPKEGFLDKHMHLMELQTAV